MKANLNFNPSSTRNTLQDLRYATGNQPITIYQSPSSHIEEISHFNGPFDGLKYSYVNDPVSEIEKCTGILIKQFPDSFNYINGCEIYNKYYIFGISEDGYKYLFKCEENTDCFMQFFCPISNKKLNMNLLHISSNSPSSSAVKIGNIEKPYKCSCCCICRPELILTLEDSNEIIGKIKEDFSFFDNNYKIINIKNQSRYYVRGNCCQCGLLCSNSICGKNRDVNFSIEEPITHEQFGVICKQITGDKKNIHENYAIKFPRNSNSNDKLLLSALGVMIVYQFFDVDPRKFKDIINNNNLI